jgi:hypothetical protein
VPRAPRNLKDRNPAAARVLSTSYCAARDQFDVWRSRVSSFWDVAPPRETSARGGFAAEYLTCNLAELVLSSGRVSPHALARLPRHSHRSPIDHWWLIHAKSGEAWLEVGERQIHARPADMLLISLDQDFRGHVTECEGMSLFLPRDASASASASLDRACNTLLSGSLAALLRELRISRSSLYRAFEHVGGVSR